MEETLRLRAIEESDQAFLLELFASSRPDLALLDPATREMLLRMQLEAQRSHYLRLYPQLEASIVVVDEQPAGRMYVACTPAEIRLLDISLLPEYRRRRIGGRLLSRLQDTARELGVPLRLHVLQGNTAQSLYERHGFQAGEAEGLYRPMEWSPG
jgi:ribosomal protein S18 acetylase RimI-like enzyme